MQIFYEQDADLNVLPEVQGGEFAREGMLENQARRPVFNARRRIEAEQLFEAVGQMMRWLKK